MMDALLTKTERQLILYDILYRCEVCEREEITKILPIGNRMIQRDIIDLTDAGLIGVTYSRKERGYVKNASPTFCDTVTGKRKSHLLRLNRLGRLMRELENDDMPLYEKQDYAENNGENPMCITAKDSYKELFPNCSERTMQRDFDTLCHIGYRVEYSNTWHYYTLDFPMILSEDFSVYRREGKLYRKR